ncbi:MAG: BatA domain-containing protein [Planctomycetes bacterium]|nr:BatA domain-containing protein [Planctomycetota bacterium]
MGFVQIGFLGALAALAAPIIVHLVFGRRARRVDLGTLRFLEVVLRENVRRRRVKRWILLALRMACVGLLAFLFARPYLAAREIQSGDRLVVILVDRSASMGLVTDRGRLLDLAIREAKKVISQCSEGTELQVAYFDHAVYPLGGSDRGNPKRSGSRASSEEATAGLDSPGGVYSSTDYGAALAWARDVCVGSRLAGKELHLFTDLQRSGFDRRAAEPLPAKVDVHLVDLGQVYPENVGVTRVTPHRLSIRPGETVALAATVFNASRFALEEGPVVLCLSQDGRQRVVRSTIDLDGGASGTVQFELTDLAEGLWEGYVEIESDDALEFDNRRHVAVMVAPPLDVLLVDGEPGESPFMSETYFLETALRLAPPGDVYLDSPFDPSVVAVGEADPLTDLDGADLIVLANVAEPSAAGTRRIAEFVESGGGLLVFTGENVRAEGYREFTAQGLCAGEIVGVGRASSLPWRLETWETDHPLFRPFSDPEYGDLRRLAFRAHTSIKPEEQARVLARFRGGEPAVVERQYGRGKILWFLSACDRDWSDWPRSRLFLPLVHQLLGDLAGLSEGGPVRSLLIDEVEIAGDAPAPGVFDRDGFHEVINVNPRESETDRSTREEFAARFQFELHSTEEERADGWETDLARAVDVRPDEIWHWVILCLLGVLFVENFLANRTTA